MDQFKPSVPSFAAKRDLIEHQWCGEAWQMKLDPIRKTCGGLLQSLRHLSWARSNSRFQSGMNSVFARFHCDVTQTGQVEQGHFMARYTLLAQSLCAEVGQGAFRRNIVNCKTSV